MVGPKGKVNNFEPQPWAYKRNPKNTSKITIKTQRFTMWCIFKKRPIAIFLAFDSDLHHLMAVNEDHLKKAG